jgi:ferredoxin-NADP reductase
VRLTAEDGYQAQRSYSIASAPDGTRVSSYLTDELQRGDQIELRRPVGGYFVWSLHRVGRCCSSPVGWALCP